MKKIKIGITGHQKIKGDDWVWVNEQFKKIARSNYTAVSCLAIGADQQFVKSVLDAGGDHVAILPYANISKSFTERTALIEFQNLLDVAVDTIVLPDEEDVEVSYFNAGKAVVEKSDEMVALWDGLPARGLGGTSDIVTYTVKQKKKITILNPYSKTIVYENLM